MYHKIIKQEQNIKLLTAPHQDHRKAVLADYKIFCFKTFSTLVLFIYYFFYFDAV